MSVARAFPNLEDDLTRMAITISEAVEGNKHCFYIPAIGELADVLLEGREQEIQKRLTKDLVIASKKLNQDEARYLVDLYYSIQKFRITVGNQLFQITKTGEPNQMLVYMGDNFGTLENQIKRALELYVKEQELGRWLLSLIGIGPVIAAGLLAHIDITKANTAGKIWRFAGLDSTVEWNKGEKRPWNADLKRLCFLLGESFVKTQNNKNAFYGPLFRQRKDQEIARNERGEYAQQAADKLAKVKIGRDTEAYKHYSAGKLPPAHIHARARRWVAKLFLSHYHHVAYRLHYKATPPNPWVIEHGGHVDIITPPNIEIVNFE